MFYRNVLNRKLTHAEMDSNFEEAEMASVLKRDLTYRSDLNIGYTIFTHLKNAPVTNVTAQHSPDFNPVMLTPDGKGYIGGWMGASAGVRICYNIRTTTNLVYWGATTGGTALDLVHNGIVATQVAANGTASQLFNASATTFTTKALKLTNPNNDAITGTLYPTTIPGNFGNSLMSELPLQSTALVLDPSYGCNGNTHTTDTRFRISENPQNWGAPYLIEATRDNLSGFRFKAALNVQGVGSNPGTLDTGIHIAPDGISFYYYATNTTPFRAFANGNLSITGTLAQGASDRRLKENIHPYAAEAARAVLNGLNAYSFTWKDGAKNQTPEVGLIAQEVQAVLPKAVVVNETTGFLTIDYNKIVPVLVQTLKDQSKEIQQLREEVQALVKLLTPT